MIIIVFLLFIAWSWAVYKIAHNQGRLTGGREGARALARYIAHFNMRDHSIIENDAEHINVQKILATFDRGGKSWSSYGNDKDRDSDD